MNDQNKVTMSMGQLQDLLIEQKRSTAEYITRNTTFYHWGRRGEGSEPISTRVYLRPYVNH